MDFYFTYHHSAGDSMYMMSPSDMDDNVVAIASLFYLIANADTTLPRDWKINFFYFFIKSIFV